MIGAAISRNVLLEPRKTIALAICPDVQDNKTVRGILDGSEWHALACKPYGQPRPLTREASAVLCQQNLPGGDWKRMHWELQNMLVPPRLIVMSRLAAIDVWTEVLNLGGYDALTKPLSSQQVLWTIATVQRSPVAPNLIEKTTDHLLNDKAKTSAKRLTNEVQDAYFDFDRYNVREDSRLALTKDAEAPKDILKGFPKATMVVEGHCDERGSAAHNLGLGDRRVTSAKEFLGQVGVPIARLQTTRYGKDRPPCNEPNKSCWLRNPRAHFSASESETGAATGPQELDGDGS